MIGLRLRAHVQPAATGRARRSASSTSAGSSRRCWWRSAMGSCSARAGRLHARGVPGRLDGAVRGLGVRAGRRARGPAAGAAQAGGRGRACPSAAGGAGPPSAMIDPRVDHSLVITLIVSAVRIAFVGGRQWQDHDGGGLQPLPRRAGAAGGRRRRRHQPAPRWPSAPDAAVLVGRAPRRCGWGQGGGTRRRGRHGSFAAPDAAPVGARPVVVLGPDGLGPVDGPPTCPSARPSTGCASSRPTPSTCCWTTSRTRRGSTSSSTSRPAAWRRRATT